jgi:hypothetical protein
VVDLTQRVMMWIPNGGIRKYIVPVRGLGLGITRSGGSSEVYRLVTTPGEAAIVLLRGHEIQPGPLLRDGISLAVDRTIYAITKRGAMRIGMLPQMSGPVAYLRTAAHPRIVQLSQDGTIQLGTRVIYKIGDARYIDACVTADRIAAIAFVNSIPRFVQIDDRGEVRETVLAQSSKFDWWSIACSRRYVTLAHVNAPTVQLISSDGHSADIKLDPNLQGFRPFFSADTLWMHAVGTERGHLSTYLMRCAPACTTVRLRGVFVDQTAQVAIDGSHIWFSPQMPGSSVRFYSPYFSRY